LSHSRSVIRDESDEPGDTIPASDIFAPPCTRTSGEKKSCPTEYWARVQLSADQERAARLVDSLLGPDRG